MSEKLAIIPRHALRFRHHLRIRRRQPHRRHLFWARTVAAQIHALAMLLSLGGILALVALSPDRSSGAFLATLVFGVSSVLLFGSSALMHFLTDGFRISRTLSHALETIDKLCIYLLIAGTYTAVFFHVISEPVRSKTLLLIWILAGVGSLYTLCHKKLPVPLQSRFISTGIYVGMGWIGVIYAHELFTALSPTQFWLTIAGGLTYSVGAVIYYLEKPNVSTWFGYHEIWHSLVAIGCSAYVAVVALAM